jgi:hypothetical protein
MAAFLVMILTRTQCHENVSRKFVLVVDFIRKVVIMPN